LSIAMSNRKVILDAKAQLFLPTSLFIRLFTLPPIAPEADIDLE